MSWSGIEQFGDLTVYERTAPDEVLSHVGDAEIALTNKTVFNADTIARLTNTKYIGVLATGYNVVDLEAASRHGIVVTNIPAYSTDSVAQHTFAHILNVTNRVDHYARASREGEWSRCPDFCYWDQPLMELSGKTIGIVGLGHIGMKVARRFCRKRSSTRKTRMIASISVLTTSWIDSSMNAVVSLAKA